MNIWDELTAIGYTITDTKLRAAWGRMVLRRDPLSCALVQEIAEALPDALLYWKLAYRAEELAEMEQSFAREIIKVKK
jgi:hypothetical protein